MGSLKTLALAGAMALGASAVAKAADFPVAPPPPPPEPVALIRWTMGDDGRMLGALPGLGYAGAVIEGMGAGHVPADAADAVGALAASMPVVLTDPAEASYYTVLGPMPIGLIGMLPVLAVAVWLTLRQMKQEEKS